MVESFAKVLMHAPNGKSAVEIVRKTPDLDLVLKDMRMPEMNGYDATKHIRTFNQDIKIIAQTAYSMTGDREKAIMAGCDEYISKPIAEKNLQQLLRDFFS